MFIYFHPEVGRGRTCVAAAAGRVAHLRSYLYTAVGRAGDCILVYSAAGEEMSTDGGRSMHKNASIYVIGVCVCVFFFVSISMYVCDR